jgi:DNA invertase Pin-like site-specific DNA recombinase
MNALKPKASFDLLVMSEESRLGREAIETAFALKQLITAGVRVFFYLEDRERTLDSWSDKLLMSVTAIADEFEREKARQRTYDAMTRKANAGHVTGGRVFGYDNVEVFGESVDADGHRKRFHVVRRINEAEAEVVGRIFELCAQGYGKKAIAVRLNDDGAVSPRAQRGRPCGWSPSSVHEVLYRDLYRGDLVWNRTKKRDAWGQKRQRRRPESEWLRKRVPTLRIVSAELWNEAHERLELSRKTYLRGTKGQLFGRPPAGTTGKYLLTGFARCGCCGGGMIVKSRAHGRKRAFRYGCSSYHLRGCAICRNRLDWPMEEVDAMAFDMIEEDVLNPRVIDTALNHALRRIEEAGSLSGERRPELEAENDGPCFLVRQTNQHHVA